MKFFLCVGVPYDTEPCGVNPSDTVGRDNKRLFISFLTSVGWLPKEPRFRHTKYRDTGFWDERNLPGTYRYFFALYEDGTR
jgi:hypothetical protein